MSETRTVKLGDVCEQVEKVNPSNEFTNSFIYIDLSAVDNQKKIITGSKEISVNEAPSRARQLLKSGDVLVSTVRPNLNAVAIVPTELDNAIGSTGFSVLRADTQKIRNDYLFAWVNNPQLVQEMVKLATGASYPAVSDRIVKESLIPLPSLAEQQRIADKFRLERLIEQKRARQRELLSELEKSVFIEIFGNPFTNPKELPLIRLEEFGTLNRGVSKHRPRNAPELLGGKYPLIQTGDIANSDGLIRNYSSTYSEFGLSQSKIWPVGTLCITIAANIAKTGILTFEACFPDSIVGFSASPERVKYIQILFKFLQQEIEVFA
ncbi:restriction endonuclease subunit S, partial [Rothia sp. ND6WE1A]|uniref:restriction endonuclease subunit S n=1 Tax=Rothia sp. ND6WE1A TaxID=1848190 RepID=UPI001146B1C5